MTKVNAYSGRDGGAVQVERNARSNSEPDFAKTLRGRIRKTHLSNYQVYRATRTKIELAAQSRRSELPPKVVAPRRLNTKRVALAKGILSDSGNSAILIDQKLKNTPMAGLGKAFKAAEKRSGINAFALASIAIHESAYGRSRIAKQKNNLFGFQAYDGSPYKSAKSFSSREQGIYHVADYLKRNYLTVGGKYYNGVTLQAVGKKYASDPQWATKVESIMRALSGAVD